MKSGTQLREEKQKAIHELMDSCLVFFAFNDKQFNENKTALLEGDKYVSIGAGGYMPKSKTKFFLDDMDEIKLNFKKELKANKEARKEQNNFCETSFVHYIEEFSFENKIKMIEMLMQNTDTEKCHLCQKVLFINDQMFY